MTKKVNQIILNAPKLGEGQRWRIDGYLVGRHIRQCPKKFAEFMHVQFIGVSNGMYHFLGDYKVLICSIEIVNNEKNK